MENTLGTQVRWKAVAMPPEHGGWGFLLEPIVLGMLVAPSWAGLFWGVAALGAFLAQHPLKLAYTDRKRGRRYARTAAAERVLLIYAGVALAGFALARSAAEAAAPLALVALLDWCRWSTCSAIAGGNFRELAGRSRWP